MKIEIYNQEGEKSGDLNLPDDIFNVDWNPDLVHEAFIIHRSNSREKVAKVKDRSEVAGGGRKPWRQKGTGRARHGSIRSPIWVGGGVTFGPQKDKKYNKKINKKAKRKAMFSLISKKFDEGEIKVIETLELPEYKTKEGERVVRSILGEEKRNALFIPSYDHKDFRRASRNIEGVDTMNAKSLNISDILSYKYIIFEKSAMENMIDHFSESETVKSK